MPTLKDTGWAIFFISVVSALMVLGVAQLDSSSWAEGVRAEYSAETTPNEDEAASDENFDGIPALLIILITIIASGLKLTLLMGLPGLITLAVRRRLGRLKEHTSAGAAPG